MTNLTAGELEVMEVLWRHGSLKPAEILDRLNPTPLNPRRQNGLRRMIAGARFPNFLIAFFGVVLGRPRPSNRAINSIVVRSTALLASRVSAMNFA